MKKSVTIFHLLINAALIFFCICAGVIEKYHYTLHVQINISITNTIDKNYQAKVTNNKFPFTVPELDIEVALISTSLSEKTSNPPRRGENNSASRTRLYRKT